MPKGPKRSAEVIGNAVHIMKMLAGEADDAEPGDGKDPGSGSGARYLSPA